MQHVAIYLRLSDEDRNKKNINDDSESIQNQKSMLIQYANEKGWDIYKIYCDEDYSGADRSRPEFNKLLKDAEDRKFNIVLCKTQSRFSRDLEIVEKYIHSKFLEWNIRFVSPVDNADTEVKGNKKARQINGLINEWFLEDLSENIRTTLRHKKENGDFTGAFAPYGYKKDPEDKNHLLIDSSAANIVKEIFKRFLQGDSYALIASDLNKRGVPTPLNYKKENGFKLHTPKQNAMCHLWSRDTIRHMLRREVYKGSVVQGVVQNISYKNSKKKLIKKDNWIIVDNMHEPVIPLEMWQKAQDKLQSRLRPQKYDGKVHLFSQKVVCGECNNSFHKSITNGFHYLRCKTINMDKNYCQNHRRIRLDQLNEIILSEINKLITNYKDDEYLKSNIKLNNTDKTLENFIKEREGVLIQLEKKQEYFKSLYEDKLNKIISSDQFLELNKGFEKDVANLKNRTKFLNEKISVYEEKQSDTDYITSLIKAYDKIEVLTRPVVDEFIEKIIIGPVDKDTKKRNIDIIWTF